MCENVDRSLEHGSRGDRECIFTHSQNFFSRTRRDKMQIICTLLQFAVVDMIFLKIYGTTTKPRTLERL